MRMMPDIAALLTELRRVPRSTASSLMSALGVGSQATFSRRIKQAGEQVVTIGNARARRYAASREIRDVGRIFPLFGVDDSGKLDRWATLRPIFPNGMVVEPVSGLPRWMRGPGGDGVFDGLPPFLADLRPAGFLGWAFGRAHPDLGLPEDPGAWTDDDCMIALARAGDDAIGNLVLGEASAQRLYSRWADDPRVVPLAERASVYADLADAAIAGVAPGPSAGGEQPKFGTLVGTTTAAAHLLVKFSPADASDAARRWRDLLLCEHLALRTLRRHGLPAVTSDILDAGPRTYLQTGRFDRAGIRGRRPVVTLAAMNDAYVGLPATAGWIDVATRLRDGRWISADTLAQVRDVNAFGGFIANSDMHCENLSLLPAADGALALAPVYDMLPMAYAPVGAEVPAREFSVPPPQPGFEATWSANGARGVEFWRAVADDARVSASFRSVAADNADAIVAALARFA